MKKLLRWVGSWGQRTASVGVDRDLVEGSPVGNKAIPVVVDTPVEKVRTVRIERKRFAAVDKECLVAGETVVVRTVHLAVEAKARPAARCIVDPAVVDTVAEGIRIGGSRTRTHLGVVETV